MISYTTSKLMFLDPVKAEGRIMGIQDIWREFASEAFNSSESSILDFEYICLSRFMKARFMVQDWNGYTELIRIERFDGPIITDQASSWRQIVTDHGNKLMITADDCVHAYLPDKTQIGFNGEVKYAYRLKKVDKLDEFIVREYNIDDVDESKPVQFAHAIVEPSQTYDFGCRIITKSGHATINNIDCYTGFTKSEKELYYK